jgi:hypothetical protein
LIRQKSGFSKFKKSDLMPDVKGCAYCGQSNDDAAVFCPGCGTEFSAVAPDESLPKLDKQEELVTLVATQRLPDADVIVGRLEVAGIEAFIPDEFLMQTIGFNLNTYGYVRVQVRRRDFENAKELLAKPVEPNTGIS